MGCNEHTVNFGGFVRKKSLRTSAVGPCFDNGFFHFS